MSNHEMEHEKAYWAREGLIKKQAQEIERLNEVLRKIESDAYDQQTADYARDNQSTLDQIRRTTP